MTVAASLAAGASELELILCIEGIGWPTDESALSSGFDGDVLVSADLNGDLATQLGCTIHTGLAIPRALSSSYDTLTGAYAGQNLVASYIDHDGFMMGAWTPSRVGDPQDLAAALAYNDVNINIDDGSGLSAGDVVWVGGSEAVLLGTKSLVSGTEYQFASSTRGYLGTPHGRIDEELPIASGLVHASGTRVYDVHRFWYARRVALFLHVPGEGPGECKRMFQGVLASSGVQTDLAGLEYTITAKDENIPFARREYRAVDITAYSAWIEDAFEQKNQPNTFRFTSPENGKKRVLRMRPDSAGLLLSSRAEQSVLPFAYRYRTEAGGTFTAWNTFSPTSVQALDSSTGDDDDLVMRYAQIGDRVYQVEKKYIGTGGTANTDPNVLRCELWSSVGDNAPESAENIIEPTPEGVQVRFLIDNWHDNYEFNHFAYNKTVDRHPISTALSFMLSLDDEILRFDAIAASTATVVKSGLTMTANLYAGAALFCVEGNNKFEAFPITANNASGDITVEGGFTNTPGVGDEYQIRNTVYDTLPFGWGMGLRYNRIDLDSFEDLRDTRLPNQRIARFVLGAQDTIDLWDLLSQNIFQPLGVAVVLDRDTGLVTAKHIDGPVGDGVGDDYKAITTADLRNGEGIALDVAASRPVGRVDISVRDTPRKVVGIKAIGFAEMTPGRRANTQLADSAIYVPVAVQMPQLQEVPALMSDKLTLASEFASTFKLYSRGGDNLSALKWSAAFNTREDLGAIRQRARRVLVDEPVPSPVVTLPLTKAHVLDKQVGDVLLITWPESPINPFATTRGWTALAALVTGIAIDLEQPGVDVTCKLLSDATCGAMAPASKLDGAKSGSDGTSDYFVVAPTEYTSKRGDKDYYRFVVAHRISLCDESGAVTHGPFTIRSFGANDTADPTAASTDIIRINEAAPAAGGITTDHYLVLEAWNASTTAAMKRFCAFAATTELYPGGDAARVYA